MKIMRVLITFTIPVGFYTLQPVAILLDQESFHLLMAFNISMPSIKILLATTKLHIPYTSLYIVLKSYRLLSIPTLQPLIHNLILFDRFMLLLLY